jgi:hypothetical protein
MFCNKTAVIHAVVDGTLIHSTGKDANKLHKELFLHTTSQPASQLYVSILLSVQCGYAHPNQQQGHQQVRLKRRLLHAAIVQKWMAR